MENISNNPAVQNAQIVRPLTEIIERECLARLASEVPAGGCIVEIGCLYGGTTAVLALAAPFAHIISIDDFSWHPDDDVPTSPELLLENMKRVGVSNVEVVKGDSREIGLAFKDSINLLWIDGGHSYEYVHADLENFGKLAEVIACHDYDNPAWASIRQAVEDHLLDHPELHLSEIIGTVAVLRKK